MNSLLALLLFHKVVLTGAEPVASVFQAYFRGLLKLSGNIGLAMKLQNLLQPRQIKSKL